MAECVVVPLGGDVACAVEELRDELARRGLHRSHGREAPHLTVAIVHGTGLAGLLGPALAEVVEGVAPFEVGGAGYGVFVGHAPSSPVLHLAVTRTPALDALHAAVVAAVEGAGLEIDGQTARDHWRPHVTLADTDVTAASAGAAVAHLVGRPRRRWTVPVERLALLTADGTVSWRGELRAPGRDFGL